MATAPPPPPPPPPPPVRVGSLAAHVDRHAQDLVLDSLRQAERELLAQARARGQTRTATSEIAGVSDGAIHQHAPVLAIAVRPALPDLECAAGALVTLAEGVLAVWDTAGARGFPLPVHRGSYPLAPARATALAAPTRGGPGLYLATAQGVTFCHTGGLGQWTFSNAFPRTDGAHHVVTLDGILPGAPGGAVPFAAAQFRTVVVSDGDLARPVTPYRQQYAITALHRHDDMGIVIGNDRGQLTLMDVRDGQATLSFGHPGLGAIGALESDGPTLMCGSANGEVSLWDVRHAAQPVRRVPLDGGRVGALAFTPHHRRRLAVATAEWIYVLEAGTWSPVPCVPPAPTPVAPTSLAWNPVWARGPAHASSCLYVGLADGSLATYAIP